MPYTSGRGYSVQSTGSNSGVWGSDGTTPTAGSSNALNQGLIQILDQNLSQTTTKSLTNADVTLTQVECQSGMYRFTGTLSGNVGIYGTSLWTGIFCWENLTTGSYYVTVYNGAGSVILPQGRRGLMWLDATNGPRVIAIAGSSTADAVPAGSVVPFYNSAAPSGYTIVSIDDTNLKVSLTAGGTTSGVVSYSTLFGRTATDSHTLTTSEIPSHTHDVKYNFASDVQTTGGGARVTAISSSGTSTGTAAATATGGGNGHTHDIDMRVNTSSVVLATRN